MRRRASATGVNSKCRRRPFSAPEGASPGDARLYGNLSDVTTCSLFAGSSSLESDRAEMKTHGIDAISLVAVNLYPFRETVAKGGQRDEVIEQIDIGGPAMVRAAAKNSASVTVVVDPGDYDSVLAELTETKAVSDATR